MTLSFHARYFDGQSSRAHPVVATVEDGRIRVQGEAFARDFALADTRVSERLQHAPRLLTFADGSYCEVADHATLDAVLAAAGLRDSLVVRSQNRWPYAIAALAATLLTLLLGYLYALPWAARIAARFVPPEIEARIGREALAYMDRGVFQPTRLPEQQRARLVARFAEIAPRDARPYRVEFRSSLIGPNALALPDGTILITDELVLLADKDEAVLGVLAHELGHIEHRHLLRRLIASTLIGAVVTLLVGDASALASALPATLAELRYSRDMEREADDYAIQTLRAHGLPLEPLADLFEKMEAAYRRPSARPADGSGDRTEGAARSDRDAGDSGSAFEAYLSTHPATAERVQKLRAAAAQRQGDGGSRR